MSKTLEMNKTLVNLPKSIAPKPRHLMVRVGSQFDGGYVIAAPLLNNTTQILTYGLGLNWDFEREMSRLNPQTRIDCYDHTVGKPKLFRKYIKALVFYKTKPQKYATYIKAYKDYGVFFDGSSIHNHFQLCIASTDGDGKTSLDSTLSRLAAANDQTFFKCDIEGAEYEIADAIVANAQSFQGIALEFHDVSARLNEVTSILGNLSRTHNIDHIHTNNMSKLDHQNVPSVIEVSLSRHDLQTESDYSQIKNLNLPASTDPIQLDEPNAPDRPDMSIVYG